MSDLYRPTDEQMARLAPYRRKIRRNPQLDDQPVASGRIFVNRDGLRWRDSPRGHGLHDAPEKCWQRWHGKGVFHQEMEGLPGAGARCKMVMIDAKQASLPLSLRCHRHLRALMNAC